MLGDSCNRMLLCWTLGNYSSNIQCEGMAHNFENVKEREENLKEKLRAKVRYPTVDKASK